MSDYDIYWKKIAEDIESKYKVLNIPCKDWKKHDVEVFLIRMSEILERKSKDGSMSYHTFWRMLQAQKGDGSAETRDKFAWYLGYDSSHDYMEKKGLTVSDPRKPKNAFSPEAFENELRKAYSSQDKFTHISILGGQYLDIAGLEMQDYFSSLSFLPVSTLREKKALLSLEKSSYRQKQLLQRAGALDKYISSDYINTHKSVIILGNPGTGKSTFARWLCHQWASENNTLSKIPVYVELKTIGLSNPKNLLDNLLQGFDTPSRHSIDDLSKHFEKLTFFLDGFDEIDETVRSKLIGYLNEYQTNYPDFSFVLLSRPYAMSGHEPKTSGLIEITGFDDSTKVDFVYKVFEKNDKSNIEAGNFVQLISDSPLLYDYSHNPLMLSYLTLIYLSVDNPEKVLKEVDSRYKLQQTAIDCLRLYFDKKQIEQRPDEYFEEQLSKSCDLAFWMEKVRRYAVYADDMNVYKLGGISLMKSLSRIGVGRLEKVNLLQGKELFQFITLSMQEFLAANRIAIQYDYEAIAKIMDSPLDWNLFRMIVGKLTIDNQADAIKEIWTTIYDEWKNNAPNVYRLYKLLLFLSELKPEMIATLFPKNDFADIVSQYTQAAAARSQWNGMLNDVFANLIAKLPLLTRHNFIQSYIAQLNTNIRQIINEDTQDEYYVYVVCLVELGLSARICNDNALLEKSIEWMTSLSQKSHEIIPRLQEIEELDIEEELSREQTLVIDLHTALTNCISELLNFFEYCNYEYLDTFREKIQAFVDSSMQESGLDEIMAERLSRVLNRLEKTEQIVADVEQLQGKKRSEEWFYDTFTAVGKLADITSPNYIEEFKQRIYNSVIPLLAEADDEEFFMDDLTEQVCRVLGKLGTEDAVKMLFKVARKTPSKSKIQLNAGSKIIFNCLNHDFEADFKIIDIEQFKGVLYVLYSIDKGLMILLRHRDYWLDVFEYIVQSHQEVLAIDYKAKLACEEEDELPDSKTPEAVTDFLQMFEVMTCNYKFPQKRYFFNRIFNSLIYKEGHIKYLYVNNLLGTGELLFFDENYWTHLTDLIDAKHDPEVILELISAQEIYSFDNNVKHLIPAWSYLFNILKNDDEMNEFDSLFQIFHPIYLALRQFKRKQHLSATDTALLKILTDILKLDVIKSYLTDRYAEDNVVYCVMNYILVQFLVPNFENMFSSAEIFKDYDMESIKSFMVECINYDELDVLKRNLPLEVFDEVNTYFLFYAL